MEKKENVFLKILSWIGLVVWALLFFGGVNYWQSGSLAVGIPITIFLFIFMAALVIAMKKHSNNDLEHASKSRNAKITAFALYVVFSLASAVFICHFVTVTKDCKTDIQNKAHQELVELGRIFDNLDDPVPGSYVRWVLDECDNYKRSLIGSKGSKEVAVQQFEEELTISSGFSDLQDEVLDFCSRCAFSVDNWVMLSIPKYLNQLNANKPDYEQRVIECSKQSEYTRDEPYDPGSEFNYEDLIKSLVNVSAADLSFISILLVLILQVMILLGYISGKDFSSRGPGRFNDSQVRCYNVNHK